MSFQHYRRKNGLVAVLVFVLHLHTFSVNAQSLDEQLSQIAATYELIGMSVVEVCEGQISFSKGYGIADYDDEIPITDSTLYRIASISKSVTATALMILYDQGLFGLDVVVNDLFFAVHSEQNRIIGSEQLNGGHTFRCGLC